VEAVQHAITRALMELEGVSVVRGEVPEIGVPAVRNAYKLEVSRLLVRISCQPDYLNIEIERIGPDGRVIPPSERFPLEIGEIGRTSTAIEHHIQRIFPARAAQAGIHPDDLDHFLRLLRAYWQDDPSFPTERILDELADIRARSPKLVDAYRLEAEIWHHRYMTSRDESHFENARDLLAEARKLAPTSQVVISGVVGLALDHGDVAEAEAALSELEELAPSSGLTMYLRALVLENQGHLQQARDMLATAVQRHPSWRIFYHLAKLEVHLGDFAAARKHLDQVRKLSPENRAGKALLELIALYTDQDTRWCQKERIKLSDLAQVNGCAVKLMEKQQYGAAALLLERARELRKHEATAFNLGEALLLAGEREQAAGAFRDVIDLIDPKTSKPSSLATRAMAMAHLGRLDDARQTITQAVARSPDNADVRYAAAVTHALIRDYELTVRAILETPASFGPAYFGYPWFDFVRKDARLRERLAAESTAASPE
jgi:tetratricopeptide (TPR) repeat protein